MNPPTIAFIDLETSGLSASKHAPLSVAVTILGGPKHDATYTSTLRPHPWQEIDQRALDKNGFCRADFPSHRDQKVVSFELRDFLSEAFPDGQLVTAGGYNYKFDESFLRVWLTSALGAAYYGNTFASNYAEVMTYIKTTWPQWKTEFPSMKLVDQYLHHFGEPLHKAHSAEADVAATKRLFLWADKHSSNPMYPDYHEQHTSYRNELA